MSNLFNAAARNLVTPQKRSATTSGSFWPFFNFGSTEGGKKVNTNSALTISAFYCGINTIANSIAMLPMSVYKKDGKNRNHYPEHAADYLLYREPNSLMTAFTFKFIMAVSLLMRGNAYALIVRNAAGAIIAYKYLDSDNVTVILNNGKLFYKYNNNKVPFSADEIIHIPGFSFDGITGRSVLEYAADNIGVSLAAQKFGSDSLGDRGVGHGVLETDLSVKADKKKEISDVFEGRLNTGGKFRAPLLDEGFKYKPITLNPQEAQFIETYASGIGDVARWLGIALHKLHVPGEGGYNFIVQMSIEYLQSAVMPMGEKFKQEFERKSFTRTERQSGVYINLNYKKLLQADPEARGKFYKDMIFVKAITPNEIRELEDMNPIDGNDDLLQMSNLLNETQIKKLVTDEN